MGAQSWIEDLNKFLKNTPLVILKFSTEWKTLQQSRNGLTEFTIAKPHIQTEKIRSPCFCLLQGTSNVDSIYLGLITSTGAVTTLETRLKIRKAKVLYPNANKGFMTLLVDDKFKNDFIKRTTKANSVVKLSPSLSIYLIERLLTIQPNISTINRLWDFINRPKAFTGPLALQDDAIKIALRLFGLSINDDPIEVEIKTDNQSAISYYTPLLEDAIIEHDARYVPNFKLVGSDGTGKAIFQHQNQFLEIYTANKRPLEKVFGVDLVYINLTKKNTVMIQYKMLEPLKEEYDTDWIYRPNDQLAKELKRMRKFSNPEFDIQDTTYRFNDNIFYLKFVKRDGAINDGGVMLPLRHYELVCNDPTALTARNAVRISFKSLNGHYLRSTTFLELFKSGYIGANANATDSFQKLIKSILQTGNSVVAAIESAVSESKKNGIDQPISPDSKYDDLPF